MLEQISAIDEQLNSVSEKYDGAKVPARQAAQEPGVGADRARRREGAVPPLAAPRREAPRLDVHLEPHLLARRAPRCAQPRRAARALGCRASGEPPGDEDRPPDRGRKAFAVCEGDPARPRPRRGRGGAAPARACAHPDPRAASPSGGGCSRRCRRRSTISRRSSVPGRRGSRPRPGPGSRPRSPRSERRQPRPRPRAAPSSRALPGRRLRRLRPRRQPQELEQRRPAPRARPARQPRSERATAPSAANTPPPAASVLTPVTAPTVATTTTAGSRRHDP